MRKRHHHVAVGDAAKEITTETEKLRRCERCGRNKPAREFKRAFWGYCRACENVLLAI